ncbi:MFS transporter [Streptomyces cinnabarinus]|uniref:MFS transporter n=1 Tax=Streptomyces cinnabarinus TaxID=67287 RepID=A0ABY7KCM1_9ACTN|nr:MFS transporter [Streptomyces cinnabarinus]WAZ21833.1 MFS transporter [Streptomyces cinnabarinus]
MTVESVTGSPAPGRPATTAHLRWLGFGAAVDSLGTGLSTVIVLLYFVQVIGFDAVSVTVAMSVGAVLGLLTPIPVGRLADRSGLVGVYVGALCLRGLGFLGYAVVDDYAWFFGITLGLMALETTTSSLQQSLVAGLFDEAGRVRAMSLVSAVRNAALGAGTLLGGLALATDSRLVNASLLAVNGLSFFVFAVVVSRLGRDLPEPGSRTAEPAEPAEPAELAEPTAPLKPTDAPPVLRNLRFLALAGANGLLFLHDSVLNELLPLWMVTSVGLSPVVMSVLLVVNTALSVGLQVLFGRMNGLVSRVRLLLWGSVVLLLVFCALCVAAERVPAGPAIAVCALAVVLLTIAENVHSVVSWQISFETAPESRRSEYMAAFSTGYGLQRVIGPVFLIGVVLARGDVGWLVLGSVFALSGIGLGVLSRKGANRQAH